MIFDQQYHDGERRDGRQRQASMASNARPPIAGRRLALEVVSIA
jgi:hypothetical protein